MPDRLASLFRTDTGPGQADSEAEHRLLDPRVDGVGSAADGLAACPGSSAPSPQGSVSARRTPWSHHRPASGRSSSTSWPWPWSILAAVAGRRGRSPRLRGRPLGRARTASGSSRARRRSRSPRSCGCSSASLQRGTAVRRLHRPARITDSAMWLTMYGFALAALTTAPRPWVVGRQTLAFGARGAALRAVPSAHVPPGADFLLWAAGSLAVYMLLALGPQRRRRIRRPARPRIRGVLRHRRVRVRDRSPRRSSRHPSAASGCCSSSARASRRSSARCSARRRCGCAATISRSSRSASARSSRDLATNNVVNLTGGPNGISGIDQPTIFGFASTSAISPRRYYWSLLLVVIAVIVLLRNIAAITCRAAPGWRSARTRSPPRRPGINTTTDEAARVRDRRIGQRSRRRVLRLEAVTIVSPDDFSFSVSIAVLSILVLGGIGNITGVHPRQPHPHLRHLLGPAEHERLVDDGESDVQHPRAREHQLQLVHVPHLRGRAHPHDAVTTRRTAPKPGSAASSWRARAKSRVARGRAGSRLSGAAPARRRDQALRRPARRLQRELRRRRGRDPLA